MDERKCKDCKWWGEERLKLWGKYVDNFRSCILRKQGDYKEFVSADTTCSKWEKKEDG